VWEDIGCAGATASCIAPWCNNRGGKAAELHRRSKNKLMCHLTPRTMCPLHYRIWQPYPKWVPRLPWGLLKLRVPRRNPPVELEPPRATTARDEGTQRVAINWCIWSPIEGNRHTEASYLSHDREVSFTPLHVGWHQVVRVFPQGITPERRLKPPGPDLTGGGGIGTCLVLWRGTCKGWHSPMNDDPESTQILTRHNNAQSETIS
jgi:hypothetical protein